MSKFTTANGGNEASSIGTKSSFVSHGKKSVNTSLVSGSGIVPTRGSIKS